MARKPRKVTKRNLPKKQMYRFNILDEYWTSEEDGNYSDKPYSMRAPTDTIHNIHGLYKDELGDIVTDINLQVGDTVFLVYVVWSTGDSFGQDRGKYLTAVHLFDMREKAESCAEAIKAHNLLCKKMEYNTSKSKFPKKFSPHSVKFIGNDGVEMIEPVGWNGYFESMDNVYVEKFSLLSEREVAKLKSEKGFW